MSDFLYLDLETFSLLDLKKVSLDRYASHPSTRILMCAYAGPSGAVDIWTEGDPGLDVLQERIRRETVVPWNRMFEYMLMWKVWKLRAAGWLDAMVHALYAGLPAGLKDCNRVPFFANESETSKETLLINKFCKPQKDGSIRDRNTDPEDWALFCQYCKDDVHDTRLIHQWLLPRYTIPDRVYRAWLLDQEINERGMPMDRPGAAYAWLEAQRLQALAGQQLKDVTGLENPNSPAQLLKWVQERGYPFNSLAKEMVKKAIAQHDGVEPEDEDED